MTRLKVCDLASHGCGKFICIRAVSFEWADYGALTDHLFQCRAKTVRLSIAPCMTAGGKSCTQDFLNFWATTGDQGTKGRITDRNATILKLWMTTWYHIW
jgi:hypothetical protein